MNNSKSNLTPQDINTLKELKDKVSIRAEAETIISSYGYHSGEVIDYDYVVDMLVEALSR